MKFILMALVALANSLHAADRPNVLFIAVDDLRPELGCYGNKIVQTPNIDRIAARGIAFNRAYCQQAVCSPSRTVIMTGLRPDVTKVWDLVTHFRAAQPDCITLPQHFKANGWHCAALSKIYHSGFEDGRSWNEPHWYPKGRAVDTDPVDWTKQIVATELYDEQHDPTETVSLADKPEHKALLESLAKHLPPVGSDLNPAAKPKGQNKASAKPAAAATDEPRDARYDRLYPRKAKLSLDEYLAKQSQGTEAKERFAKFDKNKDGFVTRDEFIDGGRRHQARPRE